MSLHETKCKRIKLYVKGHSEWYRAYSAKFDRFENFDTELDMLTYFRRQLENFGVDWSRLELQIDNFSTWGDGDELCRFDLLQRHYRKQPF